MSPDQTDMALTDDDMPPLFRAADLASLRGQAAALRGQATQLLLLIVGVTFSAIDIHIGSGLNVGALLAAVALSCSLVPAVWLSARDPQRQWYRGRAAAESIKTLAWKYAVRAQPFDDVEDADQIFVRQVRAVVKDVGETCWLVSAGGDEITGAMRRLRAAPLEARRRAYAAGRLDDQREWYARKASRFTELARRWGFSGIAVTAVGLAGGLLRAFGAINFDLLGIAVGITASVAAWVQLKQFRPLAAAYTLTGHELELVKSGLADIADEETWARMCAEAEDAISREHTMWQARREAIG